MAWWEIFSFALLHDKIDTDSNMLLSYEYILICLSNFNQFNSQF